MKMKSEFRGVDGFLNALNKEVHKMEKKSRKGLRLASEMVMEESKKKAPVVNAGDISQDPHPGYLRLSGFVKPTGGFGSRFLGIFGYASAYEIGYRAPYAWVVHENPRAGRTGGKSPSNRPYPFWAEGGSWKFLEQPLLENRQKILRIIARGRR